MKPDGKVRRMETIKPAVTGLQTLLSPHSFLLTLEKLELIFSAHHIQIFTKGAGSLGVQPEVKSADAIGVLVGCLLFFDVLPQDINRRTTAARSKIRRRPQHAPTLQPRMEIPELLAQKSGRHTLERCHQI